MKRVLIVLLSCLLLCSLFGCSKTSSSSQSASQETDIKIETEETIEEDIELQYSFSSPTITPSDPVSSEITESYFASKLSKEKYDVYKAIVQAASTFEPSVYFPYSISLDDTINIMNIVLLDTADLYLIDFHYDVMFDDSQSVNGVSLYYLDTSYEKAEKDLETITSNIRKAEQYRKDNSNTQLKVLSQFVGDVVKDKVADDSSDLSSIIPALTFSFNNTPPTSLAIAKALNLYLHHSGINSLVAICYKDNESPNFVTINKNSVSLNLSDYNFFNEVLLTRDSGKASSWYICDAYSDVSYSNYLKENYSLSDSSKDSSLRLFNLCTDRMYSGTHKFWVTESSLGVLPFYPNLEFVYAYRNGEFIPTPPDISSVYMEKYMNKIYDEVFSFIKDDKICKSNGQCSLPVPNQSVSDGMVFRFEDFETFDYFRNNFADKMRELGNSSDIYLNDFSIHSFDTLFLVYITDIYTKQR